MNLQEKNYEEAIEYLTLGKDFVVSNPPLLTQFYANLGDAHNSLKEYEKLMLADAQTSGGLLISIPENESKKIMKFCDLPWDVKCLEFYKRKDLISKTSSNLQIRKAIYKHSEKKYLPYKQFLKKYGDKYSWYN